MVHVMAHALVLVKKDAIQFVPVAVIPVVRVRVKSIVNILVPAIALDHVADQVMGVQIAVADQVQVAQVAETVVEDVKILVNQVADRLARVGVRKLVPIHVREPVIPGARAHVTILVQEIVIKVVKELVIQDAKVRVKQGARHVPAVA